VRCRCRVIGEREMSRNKIKNDFKARVMARKRRSRAGYVPARLRGDVPGIGDPVVRWHRSHDTRARSTKFEVGDIVYLNSGGPPMMIESRLVGKRVYCRWFTIDGIAQEETFPIACVSMWPGGRWQPQRPRYNSARSIKETK
jgi:uncharacterized protein YodC (DUF2158 family)